MRDTKALVSILFCIIVISINCVKAQNNLTLKFDDGSEVSCLLTTLNKIFFSDSNIVFNYTDASSNSYLISSLRKMTFKSYSAVPEVIKNKNSIIVYPSPATDFILLKNAPDEILNISIIKLDGVMVISKKIFSNKTPIDISSLTSGLYLLKVNNTTLKFNKL